MKKTLEKVKKLLPFIGIMLFAFAIYTLHKELAHMSFRDLRKAFALIPISGVFFGLMFGLGGVGSAFFGWLADRTSVEYIFLVSSFSPLLGIVAGLLPNTQKKAVSQQ